MRDPRIHPRPGDKIVQRMRSGDKVLTIDGVGKMDATDEVIGIMDRKQREMKARIRELEAEIAVRDNIGNEVLRILREATGKRDFHSEMEAAEHAAKMLAEARQDGARLDYVVEHLDGIDPDGWLDHFDYQAADADVKSGRGGGKESNA